MRFFYFIMGSLAAIVGGFLSLYLSINKSGNIVPDRIYSCVTIFASAAVPIVICTLLFRNKNVDLTRFSLCMVASMFATYIASPHISRLPAEYINYYFTYHFDFEANYFVCGSIMGLILGLWSKSHNHKSK